MNGLYICALKFDYFKPSHVYVCNKLTTTFDKNK